MTIILISIVSALVFTIWPIKKMATWMGAEKDGYGAVIFALFLSIILSILAGVVSVPLASLGIFGWILAGLAFLLATGYAFAKALGTSVMKGLGIAILGGIMGGIMQVILMFVLGAGMFVIPYDGDVSVASFEEISDDVCQCGRDEACLAEEMISLSRILIAAKDSAFTEDERLSIEASTSRAEACATEPQDYVAPEQKSTTSLGNSGLSSTVQQGTQLSPTISAPKIPKAVYIWRQSSVAELPDLVGRNVKIITIEGLDRSGKIEYLEGGDVFVQRSKNFSYSVPQNMIQSIEVYEQAR